MGSRGDSLPSARDGVAHTIKKGSDLVMQIHYHLDGKPEQDQSTVGLTFSKTPPTKGLTLLVLGNEKIDIPAGDSHYVVKASGVLADGRRSGRDFSARALSLQGHEGGRASSRRIGDAR